MLVLLTLCLLGADAPDTPEAAAGLPLVFQADFEKDASSLAGWDFTDKDAWRVADVVGNHALEQFQASKYTPRVRSPFNIALIPGVDVADFVLDLKVQSTGRDYGHRDVCLFFDHQDASHFYYIHLAKAADPHAHSVFLVKDAPRVSIAERRTPGVDWTDGWHHVRLVRKAADGLIRVYFDDMDQPIMTAHDTSFAHGRLGVGTFDDTARFDDLRVWGSKPEVK